MSTPVFQKPPRLPLLFNHTPSDLIQLAKIEIQSSRITIDALTERDLSTANFANSVLPYLEDLNNCINTRALAGSYQHIAPSAELRNAALESQKLWKEYQLEKAARPLLYALFLSVQAKNEKLEPEEQYLLDSMISGFQRRGAGLAEGETKERFQAVSKRIGELEIEAMNNVQQERGGLWFSLDELKGLPADAVACLKQGETVETEGKYFLTFKNVDVDMCLKNCVRSETRKKMFIGNENKCRNNVPLFDELSELRAEAAGILGYDSFAEMHVRDGLMTADSVNAFIAEQEELLRPKAEQEMTTMRKLKREHLLSSDLESLDIDGRIFLWDQSFYLQMAEERQSLDQTKLAEFFPLEVLIRGMLQTFETIFGLVFVEVTTEAKKELTGSHFEAMTWHQDVQVYTVWNDDARGGEFLGYLYLDLLKRDGKKDHASCNKIQQGYETSSGERQYPSILLLTSIQQPTPMRPTLVRHKNLVTIFHELGHAIHTLVGRTRFASTYGTSGVPRDFVEIPSRMLEHFTWDPNLLHKFSKHYTHLSPSYMEAWKKENPSLPEPSEQAPLKLLNILAKSKNMSVANKQLRQLSFAKYDMTIHSARGQEKAKEMDLGALYNSVRAEVTGLLGPETQGEGYGWGCGQARFQHLFHGYEASYYTYALATVYSADIFQYGFAGNLMSRERGAKYRNTILAKGGSRPPMEYMEEYLGRKPTGVAFASSIML